MKHISKKGGKYYLADGENRTEIVTPDVIQALDEYANQPSIDDQITHIPCFNPECNNLIKLTVRQKRDQLISFPKKYQKIIFVACCEDCQKRILELFDNDPSEGGSIQLKTEVAKNQDV